MSSKRLFSRGGGDIRGRGGGGGLTVMVHKRPKSDSPFGEYTHSSPPTLTPTRGGRDQKRKTWRN